MSADSIANLKSRIEAIIANPAVDNHLLQAQVVVLAEAGLELVRHIERLDAAMLNHTAQRSAGLHSKLAERRRAIAH